MGQQKDWELFWESNQKAAAELTGVEYEEEYIEEEEYEAPYRVEDIRIDQKMMSLFQIYRWIENGILDLQPEFQRNLVWDQRKKSLLIESLMLKIPIPAFYFDEDIEGQRTVIDGMQRLSTIYSFLQGEFPLKGLQYLTKCNGMHFQELEKKYQGRIEETQLAVNILDSRCPAMVKFDVFRRINTGGVPLNMQEVRNIMATPDTRVFLRKLANSEAFIKATRGKVKDTRMGAQELCLRFLTYYMLYDEEEHIFFSFGDMNRLLDKMIIRLNGMKKQQKNRLEEVFNDGVLKCYALFGERAFSKEKSLHIINRALFTSWTIVLANRECAERELRRKRKQACQLLYQSLAEDTSYFNAITSSTSSRNSMLIQFHSAERILEELHV